MTGVHQGWGWVGECLVEDGDDLVVEIILDLAGREPGDGCESVCEDTLAVVDCVWVCDCLENCFWCVGVCDYKAALEGTLDVVCDSVEAGVLANLNGRWIRLLACCEGLVVVGAIWCERKGSLCQVGEVCAFLLRRKLEGEGRDDAGGRTTRRDWVRSMLKGSLRGIVIRWWERQFAKGV